MGCVAERFNGDNGIVLLHEAVIALEQYTRLRQVQTGKHLLGDSMLHIAERIAIDVYSRRLARHKDGEAAVATTSIGDKLRLCVLHPLVGLAKLNERVLI